MPRIELIEGKAVETHFDDIDAIPFHYELNERGAVALAVCSTLLVTAAVAGAILLDITHLGYAIGIAVAGGLGLALALNLWRWKRFADRSFLAISDKKLYVGDISKVWGIDWTLLDRDALGFERMDVSSVSGELPVEVGGQRIDVHLYNALVHLKNMQGFVLHLLEHLQHSEQGTDLGADEAALDEAET
jgi:hypothetical protein